MNLKMIVHTKLRIIYDIGIRNFMRIGKLQMFIMPCINIFK